jgi:hypothetical protein
MKVYQDSGLDAAELKVRAKLGLEDSVQSIEAF